MAASPSSAATGSATMCAAAAMPKMTVSSTMRGRHLRRGPCMAWATPIEVYTPPNTPSAASTSGLGDTHALQHRGRKAVERQRRVAAQVAVEPPRDPPDASAQHDSRQTETAGAEAGGYASSDGAVPMCSVRCRALALRDSRACERDPARARPARLRVSGSPASR